ncbi:MAG: hypothetical protein AABY93_16585 [Bacteroidota bacterium]
MNVVVFISSNNINYSSSYTGINSKKINKEITNELPFVFQGHYSMTLITDGIDTKALHMTRGNSIQEKQ